MRALITGVAGFIGSSLADHLLESGVEVVGIDSFHPYYERVQKERNLQAALSFSSFKLYELDLTQDILEDPFDGVTHIFHQAGQPGVRASWGQEFAGYVNCNILATKRVLEAARAVETLEALVAASSSSVYGIAETAPTTENCIPRPISPYGVTKLASEHLCSLYGTEFGLPTVSLRYFTVYGPRQRPDMAIRRLIECVLKQETFELNGDGTQRRDFTFVSDVVRANVVASKFLSAGALGGQVFNIGGGSPVSINVLIRYIEELTGRTLNIARTAVAAGDPSITYADASRAAQTLNWRAKTGIESGLSKTIEWLIDS